MRKRSLTEDQVIQIKELGKTSIKRVEIARQFNISPQLVSTIIRYGYDCRPNWADKMPKEEKTSWEALARKYTELYPDDPLTGQRVKEIHDMAMKKIRAYFDELGLTEDCF
mgnify:CR=1 FL=1|jgi:hypothetical protein